MKNKMKKFEDIIVDLTPIIVGIGLIVLVISFFL